MILKAKGDSFFDHEKSSLKSDNSNIQMNVAQEKIPLDFIAKEVVPIEERDDSHEDIIART